MVDQQEYLKEYMMKNRNVDNFQQENFHQYNNTFQMNNKPKNPMSYYFPHEGNMNMNQNKNQFYPKQEEYQMNIGNTGGLDHPNNKQRGPSYNKQTMPTEHQEGIYNNVYSGMVLNQYLCLE